MVGLTRGVSTAVPVEKAFPMIVPEKADSPTGVLPGKVVFQKTGPHARVDSLRNALKKATSTGNALLTENRAQDPEDSAMAINLFFATGRVPGRNFHNGFSGIFSHNCTDISANRRS